MSESTYDIVILGAGSGGYATALRAAQLGMKEIENSHHKNPGSQEPKQSDDNAAESKRRRALIARTDSLVRCVMSMHVIDPTEAAHTPHRINKAPSTRGCHVA